MRLVAGRSPPGTPRSRHRPPRPRRVLRRHREARPASVARPARHRWRAPSGGGRRLLLPGARLRRALGHADVQGPGGLSRRRRRQARHEEVRGRRPRGPGDDAEPDATGGAALDRRGLHGSLGHRVPASRQPSCHAGGAGPPGEGRALHHDLRRPQLQQVPGQDRLGPGQAAWLCRGRPGGCPGLSGSQAGRSAVGREPGHGAAPCPWRHHADRGAGKHRGR